MPIFAICKIRVEETCYVKTFAQGGSEMVQLVKVLLSLSSICGTHVLEGENLLPEVVSSHIHNLISLLCVLFWWWLFIQRLQFKIR